MTALTCDTALEGLAGAAFSSDVFGPVHGVSTLGDLPFHVLHRFPHKALVARSMARGLVELTGARFFEQVRDLSLGFNHVGVRPGHRVAILSESRPEWVIADLAALCAGAVIVPIYPTQSIAQIEFILEDCGAKVVIVSGGAQLEKIRRVRECLPGLELVLVIDGPGKGRSFPDAFPLSELAENGRATLDADAAAAARFEHRSLALKPDNLATIVYTMDESGDLKGAMLTHGNLLANLRATERVLPFAADDVALSLLPLSHVFERIVLYRYLYDGVTVVFVESLMTVMRDLKRVRPTVMTGVPRVYEKFMTAVEEEVAAASAPRRWVVRTGLSIGLRHASLAERDARFGPVHKIAFGLADRLVLSKVREGTGGRLRYVVSGSAPLAPRVVRFFRSIGVPVFEGYGLTETSPVLTTNGPGANRPGTVGRPVPGVEIQIAPDGEILARGPNVMRGYLNRDDLNAVALRNGWFHTGDIGMLDADGYLTITDRKKDLIVTAGGKKVAPAPIEARLMQHPLVADAILVGENRKFVSALIAPDFDALGEYAAESGMPQGVPEELVQRADVVQIYQQLVDEINSGLAQFERMKRIAVLPALTRMPRDPDGPTMYRRRQAIEKRWHDVIDRLYASNGRDRESAQL